MESHKFHDWQVFGFDSAPARLFDEIGSTHTHMKEQAREGLIPPGTLFVADSQSAGRGRHERTWNSPVGKNLYFNILIPLEGIPPKRFAQITQVAALTFAEVFTGMQEQQASDGTKITVKWPNDILYGKSKFCGILSEIVYIPASTVSNSHGRTVPALSMGVGINVNRMRWAGVLISGVYGGLGGICYILAGVSEWKFENGVAGFGFLALAVMIFGQWKPQRIALAALLFGLFRALSNVYTGFSILAALNIPSTVYNMMPYIVSLIVLAFTSKTSRAPKAEGIPYDKSTR